jgi:hypothetical protein
MEKHQYSDKHVCILCGVSEIAAQHFNWSCNPPEGDDHVPANVVLHLVHGTWPEGSWLSHRLKLRHNKPAWYEPGSFTWTQFSRQNSVKVCQAPSWSGDNSFKARSKAAEILLTYLENIADKDKKSRHVIMAHSHGGNVALLALSRMSEFRKEQFGLITIGTPFFHVNRNEILAPDSARASLRQSPFIIISWVALQTLGIFPNNWIGLLERILIATVIVVIFDVMLQIIGKRKIEPYLDELKDVRPPKNTLVLKAAGDEAESILGIAEVIARKLYQILLFEPANVPDEIQRAKNPSAGAPQKAKLSRIQKVFAWGPIIAILISIVSSMSLLMWFARILAILMLMIPFISSIPLAFAYDPWLFGWIPTTWFQVDSLPPGKDVLAKSFSRYNLSGARHSVIFSEEWVNLIIEAKYGLREK